MSFGAKSPLSSGKGRGEASKKILFIGHDANFAGAQYLLLHLLAYLNQVQGIKTMLLLGAGGKLMADFEAITKVIFWKEEPENNNGNGYLSKIVRASKLEPFLTNNKNKDSVFNKIEEFNPDFIFSNTIANGHFLQKLDYLNKPFYIYCHEMEKSIKTYSKPAELKYQLQNANFVFTGSRAVLDNLAEKHQVPLTKLGVFPSYINCNITESEYQSVDKEEVKNQLGIPADTILVGGCGLLEWRKGIDIFNYTALQVLNSTHKPVHFIWVGVTKKSEEYYHLMYDLQRMGIANKVHLIEGAVDNLKYMACFDVFFMSSREDPYPLVMIEAGLNKTPVVCFENSGGAVDFVGDEKELIIPYLDIKKASEAILKLIDQDENRHKLGAKFNKKAWDHDISVRGPQILSKLLEFEKI